MNYLFKEEPGNYSYDELARDGKTSWTGVKNPVAQRHLRGVKKGDRIFFYHTGDEKQVVGVAEVIKESYPDATDPKGVFVAVDVKAVKPFPKPVTLATIKEDGKLKDMALVKYSRLSVQPVTAQEWRIVCSLGGLKGV